MFTEPLESETEDFLESDAVIFQKAINPDLYNTYNPERIVISNLHEDDTERVKNFYAKLTDFERGILECRRNGFTLAKIAEKFQCHATTVKTHIRRAKMIASAEFQVAYA